MKEADALQEAGHEVVVLYNYIIGWAEEADAQLLQTKTWQYFQVGGSPKKSFWTYQMSRVRFKVFQKLYAVFKTKFLIAERAQFRCFDALLKKAIQLKGDLYMAHNTGALPVAVLAAKFHQAKCGFDFEDYHRGENNASGFLERVIYLENKYVPQLDFVTASSPLITEKIKSHFPSAKVQTVLNCFSIQSLQAEPTQLTSGAIKLGWFSQTIGKGRGLEELIMALKDMPKGAFELHLLGNVSEEMKQFFTQLGEAKNGGLDIHWYAPMAPDDIFVWAGKMDVGLALETGKDENNKLALSNKIFTYLLAGNAILFSDTQAQRGFYESHSEIGLLFQSGNTEELKRSLLHFHEHREELLQMRKKGWDLARMKYNWEEEGKGLVAFVEIASQ